MIGVFYIHGFNSGFKQSTVDALDNVLNSSEKLFEIHGLQWDSGVDFVTNTCTLMRDLNQHDYEDIVLIGCSLGGFYARYLASMISCYCVLINPVVDPSKQLINMAGEHVNYVTNKKYSFTKELLQSYSRGMIQLNCNCLTYVSTADLVLPNNIDYINKYRDLYGKIITTKTNHRIVDYNELPNFANEVTTFVNTIAG